MLTTQEMQWSTAARGADSGVVCTDITGSTGKHNTQS